MAKKNSNFITTKNVASRSQKLSALWNSQTIAIFIDLCIKENDHGNVDTQEVIAMVAEKADPDLGGEVNT
ncbi:hypothetical protein L3X38_033480 [Prunus dulcis]|uniref:Uncharacterized protein n=1 Tax=Prunus dulcis TaxID=3755 RepID=A0AAD4VIE8_PRUDU|nr:hypothetical protein L3X38_033480 [Prunus dulcis]